MKRKRKIVCYFCCIFFCIISLYKYFFSMTQYENIRQNMLKKESSNVRIAIIDSGISVEYIDECESFKDFTSDNNIIDKTGHGTSMYEIIHSKKWGIAPNVRISILKVTTSNGKTSFDDVIKALKWCENNNVNIVSMSLATSQNNKDMYSEIKKMSNLGIHIFSAVSNTSGYLSYPDEYKEVIGIYAWQTFDFYDKADYYFLPVNDFIIHEKVRGNSAATAFCAAMASYHLTESNEANKEISNLELFEYILEDIE